MAIFKWKITSYGKGGAQVQSDYVWGRGNFSLRSDVVATGCGNLPGWCGGVPFVFFATADAYERQNGSACRHLVVSLPRELGLDAWIRLVETLIARDLGPKPYQWAIHNDLSRVDEHPHAHIVYSDRVPDAIDRPAAQFFLRHNPKQLHLGGAKKDSGGLSLKHLGAAVVRRKELWADMQNEALAQAGVAARVDHRTGGSKPR